MPYSPDQSTSTAFHQAQSRFNQGRFEEAASLCRNILSEDPNHPDALTLLGIITLNAGAPADANGMLKQALEIDPSNVDAWCNLAVSFNMLGDPEGALCSIEKALDVNPHHVMTLFNLGWTLRSLGRLKEALLQYKRVVEIDPDFIDAWNNMGEILRRMGEMKTAITCYQKALAIEPAHVYALNNVGMTCLEGGLLNDAARWFEKAIEIDPDYTNVYNNLGTVCLEKGEAGEAIAWFQEALSRNPEQRDEVLVNLGNALQDMGRFQEAREACSEAISINPANTEAWFSYARSKKFSREDPSISTMETLLAGEPLPLEGQVNLHFALGKVFDDAGEYEKAFEHYAAGNGIHRSTLVYDVRKEIDFMDRIIHFFNDARIRRFTNFGSDSVRPLFIIGMPRSGTSLVEQILSSHPEVSGGGELTKLGDIAESLGQSLGSGTPFPECLETLSAASARRAADQYLGRLFEISRDSEYVTDKATRNAVFLGLIAVLFPKARIIHCRRDPLDNCLSCYFQRFISGYYYAYDLSDLGLYYRAHDRIMRHWSEVLQSPFLEADYQKLVTNQEEESRRLIDFCGLQWDESCLEFHKTLRPVRTASNYQVRQPIYKTSVQRWRHYSDYLGPLKRALSE